MNFKTLLLSFVAVIAINTTYAQDKLYKKNGDMMEVSVTEITPRTITYKKTGNPEGPSYTINKGEVAKIIYPNGSEDYFGEADKKASGRKRNTKYGNNIISIMPLQITSNVGVGIAYERVIDKDGILSFYLPATIAFVSNAVDPVTGIATNNTRNNPTFYIMPGLKFYPTGGKGVVRYSVGPNLTYITGKEYVNNFIYDDMGNIIGQDIGDKQRSALGIMVTNGLNINPNAHLHLGLELGIGFTYFNKIGNVNDNSEPIAQFGFKLGYRF